MIKLIASDIDGTLVENSTAVLHSEMFDLIKKIKTKGHPFLCCQRQTVPEYCQYV